MAPKCDITPRKMNSIDVRNHTRSQDFFPARNILKKHKKKKEKAMDC